MMRYRLVFPAIVIAGLFSTQATAVTLSRAFESPRVTSGDFQIRTACMMPAEGRLRKLGMKGTEGMTKESDAWSTTLQTVVESHLKLAGVQVVSATGASDATASEDELRQLMLRLQEKYDGISAKIEKKPKDIAKSRFTVGDEVALLPCTAKADVLVFAEGNGQVLTGGKAAFGILVAGPSSSMAHLALAMVDAKSGEVMAFVRMDNNGKFVSDSEKAYGKALDKQFKKMRIGTTADKVK